MFFAFLTLFMLNGGVGILAWLGWQRMAEHMRKHPEAAHALAAHLLRPLLFGEETPPEEPEP